MLIQHIKKIDGLGNKDEIVQILSTSKKEAKSNNLLKFFDLLAKLPKPIFFIIQAVGFPLLVQYLSFLLGIV